MKKAIMIMAIAAGLYACGGGETTETKTKPIAMQQQKNRLLLQQRKLPLLLQKRNLL